LICLSTELPAGTQNKTLFLEGEGWGEGQMPESNKVTHSNLLPLKGEGTVCE